MTMNCLKRHILLRSQCVREFLDNKLILVSQSKIQFKRCKGTLEQRGPSHLYNAFDKPLINVTIGEQLDTAAKTWPDRECVYSLDQNIRLTFYELKQRVEKLAAGFVKLGLKNGDTVCLWAPNSVEWYLTFLALSKIGAITVGVNPSFQQPEIEYCINKVNAKAVVSTDTFKSQNYGAMLTNAKSKCPSLENIIIISKDHVTGTRRFADVESLASDKEVDAIHDMQKDVCPNKPCNIQFTSGTTGWPKATTLSHKSIANNSMQGVQRIGLHQNHNKICVNVPFFHAFGLLMVHVGILHCGATMIIEGPSFNPVKSVETIVKEKCTVTFGTPTMWINMIDVQRRLNFPLNTLLTGVTGGSPAAPELFKNIRSILGCDLITSIYGLTETTGIAFQNLPEDPEELIDTSIGYLSNHVEVMVADDHGKPVEFESPGELWIRGYSTMLGYWNDEKETKAMITENGWLKTGDLFRLRQDGYGYVIGRVKDMIIRGGENVYPREIEDFFITHPAILEIQVIGAHDNVYGEEICACIKLKSNEKISADQLRNFAKGKIAHYKIPRFILFIDDFPKTATGKVQKKKLKEEMERRKLIPSQG